MTSAIQLVLGIGLLLLLGWAAVSAIDASGLRVAREEGVVAITLGACIAAAGFGTYGLMALSTLGLVAAKSVLVGEFAALGRADRGESVLARMRRAGKKG